jgi:hypothetical protein
VAEVDSALVERLDLVLGAAQPDDLEIDALALEEALRCATVRAIEEMLRAELAIWP